MRLGVLDVGSNTVHLQVVDAHPGARPSPATNQKVELRLHEYLNKEGEITPEGVALLEGSIADAIAHAKEFQTEEILAFATSAIRDARIFGISTARVNSLIMRLKPRLRDISLISRG